MALQLRHRVLTGQLGRGAAPADSVREMRPRLGVSFDRTQGAGSMVSVREK